MADAGTIARFMVELAFKQDEGSAQKFVRTVDQSEKAVGALQQAVIDLGKAVQDLGRVLGGSAVEEGSRKFANNAHKINQSSDVLRKGLSAITTTAAAAGGAWVAAISKIASEYEKLYYTARRVGGTVGDLKAAGDAANQAGIGAEALGGALEGITSQVRASPGIRVMVNNWIGADWDKVRDKVKNGLIPVLDRLTKMPREWAYQWADQLGISRRVLDDWIVNGEDFKKRMAEVEAIQKRGGVDQEKLAQQSKEFWNSIRMIGVQVEQIWGKAFQEAYPAIKLVLDTLQGVLDVVLIINKNVPGAAFVESLVMAFGAAKLLLGVLGKLTGLELGGSLLSLRSLGTALMRIGSVARFALGPWGILIGVAVEAAMHWRELAGAFAEIGNKIGQAAALVAGNVSKAFSDLLATVKPFTDAIYNTFASLASALKPIGDTIVSIIKPIGDMIGYVAEKLGLVSTEQEKAARAAEAAKPGYVPGYGVQKEQPGQPGFTQQYGGVPKAGESTISPASPAYIHRGATEQSIKPQEGQHPTGEFFNPYGGVPRKPYAAGGVVPIDAHAGEIVLPQKLSGLLLGVVQSLSGGGGKGGDPWGDAAIKTPLGRMLDWLSGAVVPKVKIDNVDDFEDEAEEGKDGEPGPGGIRKGIRPRTGAGGRHGGGGAGGDGGVDVPGYGRVTPESGQHPKGGYSEQYGGTLGVGGLKAGEAGTGPAGPIKTLSDRHASVDRESLYKAAVERYRNSPLKGFIPKDGAKFGITTGSPEEWARLSLSLAHAESSLQANPREEPGGGVNGAGIGGAGLMQFGKGDLARYGVKGEVTDPNAQLEAQIRQFEGSIPKAGAIQGANNTGASAYFGAIRRPQHVQDFLPQADKIAQRAGAVPEGASAGGGAAGGDGKFPAASTGTGGLDVLKKADIAHVSPALVDIYGKAAAAFKEANEGYKVQVSEGYNPEGHAPNSQHHHAGTGALDMKILRPDGTAIPNRGFGEETVKMYSQLHRLALGAQKQNYPNLKVGFGPQFETSKGSGVPDWMHGDLAGERGPFKQFQISKMGPLYPKAKEAQVAAGEDAAKKGEEAGAAEKSPLEKFNDGLIKAAQDQAAAAHTDAAKKSEAAGEKAGAKESPIAKFHDTLTKTQEQQNAERLAQTGRPLFPPGTKFNKRGEVISGDLFKDLPGQRTGATISPEVMKSFAKANAEHHDKIDEMKEKIDAAKTGGGELKAGGALTKSGANFDRALSPIGTSGLSPGAGGDSVTNNSGGNRNMNVNATNNVTINGNHGESPGRLARRFSDNSERFYSDLGRNSQANVS